MIGRIVSFTITAFLALAVEAAAQIRDVEVFYDQYGREVLVDVLTGQVVDIREPRGSIRRFGFEPPREPWRDARPRDPYYDDYEDTARQRRERRMEQLGRAPLPDYRDYRALPDPVDPGWDYDYDYYDDDYYEDEFSREDPWRDGPEPPAQRGSMEQLPPPPAERDRGVERAPLDGPSVAAIPDEPGLPDTIIEEAPPSALRDLGGPPPAVAGASEDVVKIQVLLDRVGASPGVIDGRIGDNVNKAISAYREITGERLRTYDKDYVEAQLQATGGDAFTTYEITPVDVAGQFVASIPEDYGEKARMERLGFTSVAEMLAERFHMDERYLRALNPGVNFDRPGTIIRVVNVGEPLAGTVTRIVADKGAKQVRAYRADGRLVAAYPATIGSTATPSPTGSHTVERIAFDPEYTYNPRVNFQQGNNTRVLTIPPGPNGPVGTVWIGLSKPTYGIHGTPEPSLIGRTESNGCIRLTNWDAQELAKMVEVGTTVEFVE